MLVGSLLRIWCHQPSHRDLSVSDCFVFLPRFRVHPPRPFNAGGLIIVHLVAPTSRHDLPANACLFFRPPLLVPHHHDLSMRVGSFLHVWWRQPPARLFSEYVIVLSPTSVGAPLHDFSVSGCLIVLPHLLVPHPRPFNACWLVLAPLPHLVVPPPRLLNTYLLILAQLVAPPPPHPPPTTTAFQCLCVRPHAAGGGTPSPRNDF